MTDSLTSKLTISGYMLLNFVSSVGILWANKFAYNSGFPYATTLTFLHFIVTFVGLEICARCGFYERKALSIKAVAPISAFFCAFVVFTNLSLKYNTLGVNQLLKVMTTPVIVAIQYFFYDLTLPSVQILSLIVLCTGVVLATVSSLDVNAIGLFWGCAGILTTSMYQILVKTQQQALNASPQQLLYYQSIVSAGMLACIIPFVEPIKDSILSKQISVNTWCWVSLSALLAFLVNMSVFLVIGKTSPVSYNVLGHGKLCVILTSGFVFFGERGSTSVYLGIALAVIGIVWYTHLKLQNEAAHKDFSKL